MVEKKYTLKIEKKYMSKNNKCCYTGLFHIITSQKLLYNLQQNISNNIFLTYIFNSQIIVYV